MKRQLATVSLLTALAQLLGFVKLWFVARIFGIGPELDAYNLALVLPTLASAVLAGALQTGLFPVRAHLAHTSADALPSFERAVLWSCISTGLALSGLLVLIGPELLAAFSKVAAVQAYPLLRVVSLVLLLNLGADCCSYLLAMRDSFAIAAAAPIANAIVGTLFLAVWPQAGLEALVAGTLAGSLLQLLICMFGLHVMGLALAGPLMPWRTLHIHARKLLTLGGWILPGVVFSNLVVALPTLWIASSGEGAVSAYGYASRLHSALLQFIFMASSIVVLARFSVLVARGEEHQVGTVLRKASIFSAVIGISACALIAPMGAWALQVLFSGRFDARAAETVAQHWLILTAGLPFAIVGTLFAKLWQAQGRPQLISCMAGLSFLTLFALHGLLAPAWGQYAVSMAQSAAAASVVLGGLWFVAHRPRRALNG